MTQCAEKLALPSKDQKTLQQHVLMEEKSLLYITTQEITHGALLLPKEETLIETKIVLLREQIGECIIVSGGLARISWFYMWIGEWFSHVDGVLGSASPIASRS